MLRREATSALPWRSGRPPRRRSLIGLTPLIDVVFILLVFFMLATSLASRRAIELAVSTAGAAAGAAAAGTAAPSPGTGGAGGTEEEAVLVEVRPDGRLRLSAAPVSLDVLAGRIGVRMAENPGLRVLVEPAGGVSLGETVRVLDVLSQAGVSRLSLVRSP